MSWSSWRMKGVSGLLLPNHSGGNHFLPNTEQIKWKIPQHCLEHVSRPGSPWLKTAAKLLNTHSEGQKGVVSKLTGIGKLDRGAQRQSEQRLACIPMTSTCSQQGSDWPKIRANYLFSKEFSPQISTTKGHKNCKG